MGGTEIGSSGFGLYLGLGNGSQALLPEMGGAPTRGMANEMYVVIVASAGGTGVVMLHTVSDDGAEFLLPLLPLPELLGYLGEMMSTSFSDSVS